MGNVNLKNCFSIDKDEKSQEILSKNNRLKRIAGAANTKQKMLQFLRNENQFLVEGITDTKISILQAKRAETKRLVSENGEEKELLAEIENFLQEIEKREEMIKKLRQKYVRQSVSHEQLMKKKRKQRRENTVYWTYSDH